MLMDRVRHTAAIMALSFAAVLCGEVALCAQEASISADSVRSILDARIARGGGVGLAVGRIVEGRSEAIVAGVRRAGGSEPVDERTVFEIGSISKVFTTALLADMVVRGELSLDDPVSKFLPQAVRMPARNGREITLLDLATSTSGLPRLPANMTPADPANPYADYDAPKLYAFLSGYTLPRDPGAAYEYSNLGMGLLGHVLALHAGKPYEELVRERILTPLGMADTRIALTPELRARLAAGHGADLEPAANWELDALAGAGAWRSTAADMLRFVEAAMDPPDSPLGRALAMAVAPRRETGTPGLRIGLGWHVLTQNGRDITWHNGQTGGYHSFLGFAEGTGVVVLANSATNIDDIGLHLVDPASPVRHPAPARPAVDVAADVLERYAGRYELTPQFVIEVTREGGILYAQATGQPRFRLFAASPTRFFLRVVEAEVEFTTDAAGNVTGLVLHQGGRETSGRRLPGR